MGSLLAILSAFAASCFPLAAVMLSTFSRLLSGALTLHFALGSPIASPPYSHAPHVKKNHLGAVASESEICSHIGTELLKKGGNAADALVGTVFCVGVVGMYHSGMLCYSTTNEPAN